MLKSTLFYVILGIYQLNNAMKSAIAKPVVPVAFLMAFVLFSCDEGNGPEETHPVSKESLSGLIQKGPFINGTSINVAELNANMAQTGKNFGTQTTDNRGSFELRQLELSSQFVELKADGFYYNEVSDTPSSARLILYALSDLTDKNTLNVNLLSHLEKDRIYHLVSEGASFSEAKRQAQQEILEIFSMQKPDIRESELLDITKEGDDHAILLAISLILQGHRSVAELSGLLADINSDIREDGELNDASTGSALMNHAALLDLPGIRENLEKRYEGSGLEVKLPDFEKYIGQFIEHSGYAFTACIEYPEFSDYGENILCGDKSVFQQEKEYSMAAAIPVGAELTVRLSGGLWGYQTLPDGPVNWDVSHYDWNTETQTFTAIESGTSCDLKIMFMYHTDSTLTGDGILVEYFENRSDTATRTKMITVEEWY
jgi:hypothetical protein